MPIADSVRNGMSHGSLIRRMFEEGISLKRRWGGANVFDLSLGNPIIEPPYEFGRQLEKLIHEPLVGSHRYMPNAGYEDTRKAVADYLSEETGLSFSMNEIVMTCGAAGAINIILKTILNPGDEVIVFTPYFVEYLFYISNHQGRPIVVPTDDSFLPQLDQLDVAIGPKTKALIINSPNNPTGVVYKDSLLAQLSKLLIDKERQYNSSIYLISDEAYRKIIFNGLTYPWILHHYPNSIILTSHSKDLSLPGERIGYLAVHPHCADGKDLINGSIFCNRILGFVNAPALMQNLVKNLQRINIPIEEYQRKRDTLYNHLTDMGYQVNKPEGAFYIFPKSPIKDDIAFVNRLQQLKVLTVPGSGFGAPGYFRIAYCVSDQTIDGALVGLQAAIKMN